MNVVSVVLLDMQFSSHVTERAKYDYMCCMKFSKN